MRLAACWLPVCVVLPACLGGALDRGACNDNHVCEPDESYEVCPQDCYWHSGGAAVVGKPVPRAGTGTWPGMAPAHGDLYERAGNGVCELRESWRFSPDCAPTCGDGEDDPDERATCMADVTLALARTECNGNGVCEFQTDERIAAALAATDAAAPRETAYNCPLDCTPMGPAPIVHVFEDDTRTNTVCDAHENHANWPDECAAGCHDGCCAPGEADGPCPGDCAVAAPVACPCTGANCLQNCGDGVKDPDEACDDGNAINTDACTDTCSLPACGDGFVQPGEQCDDGNAVDDDACTNACTPPTSCGDGVVDAGETCDDGNAVNTDACTTLCQPPACGDGFLQAGEQCDDGPSNSDTAACTAACEAATCGDALVHAGVEQCDDGNKNENDACLGTCTAAVCGDARVQTGVEQCDDGNKVDLDECGNDCVPSRRVFVVYPGLGTGGNLGGILGADFLCNTRAGEADLPGAFKAWLTDADADTAPALRFGSEGFTGWYLATDGTAVAHGWDDLVGLDGADYLTSPIRSNEHGTDINVDASVWTNTGPDGLQDPANKHCDNWTHGGVIQSGSIGISTHEPELSLAAAWTQYDTLKCNNDSRLYCFQTAN